MKTKLILLLAVTIMWSCNQPATNNGSDKVSGKSHEEHAHTIAGLVLNNGAKWDSDESTNTNVKQIEEILSRYNAVENRTLDGYINTGAELQKSIELLIQGCRMQGPDHDALHLWLEPLMMKVKELNSAEDVNMATSVYDEIKTHVAIYKDYFE